MNEPVELTSALHPLPGGSTVVRKFVDLGRTFLDLPARGDQSDPDVLLEIARTLGNEFSWADIRKSRYVVVLGEAGTGKTTEFRVQLEQQRGSGHFAWLIAVEELANVGLAESIGPVEFSELERWRQTDLEASFFLDALDEAKLRGRKLGRALRRLQHGLGIAVSRARLVVSCRVSDWLANADKSELEAIMGAGIPARVVQLAPLNEEQIGLLAAHFGVSDVLAFTRAIAASNAQVFAHRPLDVEWLAAYWRDRGQLGRLEELIDHNIQQKLKEDPERNSSLSAARALEGAIDLAGLATVTGHRAFMLPDLGLDFERSLGAINPREALRDWSDSDIRELLARPIFDEATYGRVRFHHRSVQEYLAARWLRHFLERGLPRRELNRLLFNKADRGVVHVPRHLTSTVAWLSLWDGDVRRHTLRHVPEVLLDEGDPSGLSVEDREAILLAYVSKFTDRERVFLYFEQAGLGRFAATQLSDTIRRLLQAEKLSEDVHSVLLGIAAQGRLRECVPEALSLLFRPETRQRVRCAAIRAIGMLGNAEQKRRLLTLVHDRDVIDHEVAAALVSALFPGPLDTSLFLMVVKKVPDKSPNFVTSFDVVLRHELPNLASQSQRIELLTELYRLIIDKGNGCASYSKREWLVGLLEAVLVAVMDADPAGCMKLPAVENALALCEQRQVDGHDSGLELEALRKVFSRHELLRRTMFWRQFARVAKQRHRVPTRLIEVLDPYKLWDLSEGDERWLAEDAKTRRDGRERLLAFDALATLLRGKHKGEGLAVLREIAGSDPSIERRLRRMLNRARLPTDFEISLERRERARSQAQRKAEQRDRAEFERRFEAIRRGDDFAALMRLYQCGASSNGSFRTISFDNITASYGDDVAQSARVGLKTFWRKHSPVMPHERSPRNALPYASLMGLVGLELDIADGLDVATLDGQLMACAVRYATCGLGNLPTWLEQIALVRRDIVSSTLEPAIAADYRSSEVVHDVLAKLPLGSLEVRKAVAPVVRNLLVVADPPTLPALRQTLAILEGIEEAATELDQLARQHCSRLVAQPQAFAIWWCNWADHEGLAAVEFLESMLSALQPVQADQLVLAVCDRLWTFVEGPCNKPLRLCQNVRALARFTPIVYSYVRPVDDISHDGAFHPSTRDHAQMLRDSLTGWMASVHTDEAIRLLQELAEDARMLPYRDWLRHQADASACTVNPWRLQDAIEWKCRFSKSPQNAKDLFQVAEDRLDDLRLFVESDECSLRGIFKNSHTEEDFQKFIASELERRSCGHYTVSREEEVDREKKPDIRLHNPACSGPVGIEVKVADRWSYSELDIALREQLVGQYLSSVDANYGIFVLCFAGKDRKWRAPAGGELSFAQLVGCLSVVANTAREENRNVHGLVVLGIDFR